ncbi:MAG: hypothetical protein QOG64_721 [Acidimicrobiaceae bacterium]|nr:hypothetical protein [Acidimicrobiaceae bacterium]
MPVTGTLDPAAPVAGAPTMSSLATDPLTLEGVRILHVFYEIEATGSEALIPPALHPTVPPTVAFTVWKCPASPWGPFTLAQVGVGCRAGVRPRRYLLSAVVDNETAGRALAERWGYRITPGTPVLRIYHDLVEATVERDGAIILQIGLGRPEPISGGDVQYVANMNPAHTPDGFQLVQVDPEYTFSKADRGRPSLPVFEAAAWGDDRVRPSYPVSAASTVADITLPKIRYIARLDVPALQGTTAL